MSAGRPSDYTAEIATEICARISDGRSVRSIAKDDDMPGQRTIFQWLAAHVEFAQQYVRACEERAHYLAEEALEIADDGSNDTYLSKDGAELVNYDHIQRSKLRVDTRKWFASKLAPKAYGEKVQHAGDGGGPLQIVVKRYAGD